MAKKVASVNLVKPLKASFFERFIDWTLSIGRLVVIVTEVIALGAFIFRFSLDQQLIDLHSKIKQEQAIVNYLKDSESSYRNLQSRLIISSNSSKISSNRVRLFDDVIGLAPQNITFGDFSLNNQGFGVTVNSDSVNALQTFVNSLKSYPAIASVSIDKIENRPANGLVVVKISADLKSGQKLYEVTGQ